MNQFFYTRKEPIQGTDPLEFKEYLDSFNIEKVIRTIIVENENRLVLLDDIHERSTEVPDVNPKNGQVKGYKRERNTYQTEIYLTPEDSERFVKLLNIVDV
jgi:hypothetical protein